MMTVSDYVIANYIRPQTITVAVAEALKTSTIKRGSRKRAAAAAKTATVVVVLLEVKFLTFSIWL